MAQNVILKAQGLHTFSNYFSDPQGALEEALNVVVDRDDIIEPRRGLKQYSNTFGVSTNRIKQLFSYKDRILAHYGDPDNPASDQLAFDSDGNGTFTAFPDIIKEVTPGKRIKGIEFNGNFYFTTDQGVKKLSAASSTTLGSASIIDAGGPKALNVSATMDYTNLGFMEALSKAAYRVVWGYTDANENLILGAVSERVEIANPDSSTSGNVKLTFTIPADVTSTDFFYQIYRTQVFTAGTLSELDDLDTGDEMFLVAEGNPTAPELTAKEVEYTDETPEIFREGGTLLYTNPVSGSGIEQNNEKPPLAKDIEIYKNYVFYANTSTLQRLNSALLSISGLTTGTSTISVSDGTTTRTYTFRGNFETYTVDLSSMTFPSGVGTGKNALDGAYFILSSSSDDRVYKIWFDATGTTPEPSVPGTISIKVDITATADTATAQAQAIKSALDAVSVDFNITESAPGVLTIENSNNGLVADVLAATTNIGDSFSISRDSVGIGEDTSSGFVLLPKIPSATENGPTISQQVDQAARSLVKVINSDSAGIVSAYYLSTEDTVPGEFLLENREIEGAAFSLTADSTATGSQFSPTIPTSGTSVSSDNEVRPNRIYYSKLQEPEAVPLINFIDIGPKDEEIQRIVALRDSLFIFKDEGIYRLTGDIAPNFFVAPFDSSVFLTAPDSIAIMNNQIYALSTQGVITVTDTGVSVISRPIEDLLLNVSRTGFEAFRTATFGVSYESERSYHLWTVTNNTDTEATQCFRYNTFTNSWTRWDKSATCGIVNLEKDDASGNENIDDKLYIGAGGENFIDIERKDRTRTDYADREFVRSVPANAVNDNVLKISSTADMKIGDVIIQTQYLTIAQYNRVIGKLGLDPTVTLDYSTLAVEAGVNLRSAVDSLATTLDSDPVTLATYNTLITAATDFPTIQSEFNAIVTQMNTDPGVFYSNYPLSSGTIEYEGTILEIDDVNNKITLSYSSPYVEGDITVYEAIQTRIEWRPEPAGDPTIMKQFNQGTLLFEDNNFTTATVAYGTDLSPGFEEIEFDGSGIGDWGQFAWGNQNWGGVSNARPLRTLVPRQKQRCRFMNVRFTHGSAFEKFSLYGISLTFRPYSERAYK